MTLILKSRCDCSLKEKSDYISYDVRLENPEKRVVEKGVVTRCDKSFLWTVFQNPFRQQQQRTNDYSRGCNLDLKSTSLCLLFIMLSLYR